MSEPLKIIIIDDHDLVREGIASRLSDEPRIKVIGSGDTGQDAIELALSLKPDLVMLDISMPGINGLIAAETILKNDKKARILFLSVYDNPEYVREALRIGASGFILKDVSRDEMINAIIAVSGGGTYLDSHVASSLGWPGKPCQNSDKYGFTSRELEVLTGIANGLSNREIASKLDISVRTVESHRLSIRDKTGGGNAIALSKIAEEIGVS